MHSEAMLSAALFASVLVYGAANIYIVTFLRKHEGLSMGLAEFLAVYAGNIKNYKKLNEQFLASSRESPATLFFNRLVALAHLLSPFLIPASIVVFIAFG